MPEPANIQRHFLGGDQPALPAAAGWLLESLAGDDADLGDVLVVVPGGRAQRRLYELLAEPPAGRTSPGAISRALVPPTIVTVGGLADRLMPPGESREASDLESLLAWAEVLREAEPELIGRVLPHPPGRDDWPGWWALGEQVAQAAGELGAHLLLVQDVSSRVGHTAEAVRWEALAELDRRYHALLNERGRADLHAVRRGAISAGSCASAGPVVLIATVDLMPVQEQALAYIDAPVHALVFADRSDAEGFDTVGGLAVEYWAQRAIPIDDAALVFADRPGDQSAAVLDAIRDWSDTRPTAADDITVGIGDTSLNAPVERTLGLAGLPVRSAVGQPVARSRPVLLLTALAEFASGLRFDKLAQLIRHPDAESYLTRTAGASARPWLTLLDRYATDHLAQRPVGGWLGDPDRVRAMDAVYQAALSLLPEPVIATRAVGAWAEPIGALLEAVYGERQFNRGAPADRPVVEALQAIGGVLEQLASLDDQAAPHCSFAQAVTLVVSRLASRSVAEPGGEPAIELVGYLELLLDDAPNLVIAGMNEQHVPEPPRPSMLMSDGTRRALGLDTAGRRVARDGYALSMMLQSRSPGRVRLIAGRRSRDGDPLLPSRLLLRAPDDTLVQRVSGFVEEQGDSRVQAPLLLTPGMHDRFLLPYPVLPDAPITTLRVTAFRDYLACPYRFYLKHVLGLRVLDDRAAELSAGDFGTLAHQALRILADPAVRGVDDPQAIAERLGMALDQAFERKYGRTPAVAARIQAEQLRHRLDAFAPVQARLVAEGWRIMHHEEGLSATVDVDGQPFTVTGQVDRIDHHPDGRWRLIDYKTSDSAKPPMKTHRKRVDGENRWVDLQLPLYLDLSAELRGGASAELGYINLPKKSADSAYSAADWSDDELASARAQRDEVIRLVRAGVFWPPKLPPVFDDGLKQLCADQAPNRPGLIVESKRASAGGSGG